MTILLHDIFQYSDLPLPMRSPSLADTQWLVSPFVITLDKERPINAIGLGNTDGSMFAFEFNDPDSTSFEIEFSVNGLYLLPKTVNASQVTIVTDAIFIGRIAAGLGIKICTALAKEPAWHSTGEPRVTLAGQVVAGRGGYNYRTLSLDSRYKINETAVRELQDGYKYIGMGYPFFLDLTEESYKLPYAKLYAEEDEQRSMSFEGGIHRFPYSRRFNFTERF